MTTKITKKTTTHLDSFHTSTLWLCLGYRIKHIRQYYNDYMRKGLKNTFKL